MNIRLVIRVGLLMSIFLSNTACDSPDQVFPQILEEGELQCWARGPEAWSQEYAYSKRVILGGAETVEVIYDCIYGMQMGKPHEWGPYRALLQFGIPEELKKKDREGNEYFRAGKCAVLFLPAYEAFSGGDPKETDLMMEFRIKVGRNIAVKAAELRECR